MNRKILVAALVALLAAPAAQAQLKGDFGKREYDSNCAVCHGPAGKGDGPWPYATAGGAIPDLTTLAKRSGGRFPYQKVYEAIDGTAPMKAHGTRDMPVWGERYRTVDAYSEFDVAYDPDAYVRARILALTDYLNRLQAK